jgi:exopolysaccharide biosynthesis polyprenyl glycosylphosphotransferase
MFGSEQRKAKILFALSDVVLTALAFAIAFQLRLWLHFYFLFDIPVHVKALLLGFSSLAWLCVGFWRNVYGKLDSARIRVILGDSFRQAAYSGLALVVLVYALKLNTSRAFLALFIALSWVLVVLWRMGARNLVPVVRREFGVLRYVLIVGVGERAQRLARHLEEYYDHGLRILGFLRTSGEIGPNTLHFERRYRVFPVEDISLMLRKQVVDEVFFAVESERLASLEEIFLVCDEEGVCSRLAVDYFPHVNSRVTLERLDQTPLLTFSAAPDDEVLLLAKRAIDIAVAGLAVCLLSPLLILVAVLIRLTSPGPVVFRQVRCGLNGRNFIFYKFRSMVVDAEYRMNEVAHLNPKEIVTKIPNDPRLTRVGKWLRKFSIDELPQLFNVLKGDMSLVGPRPAIPSEVAQYKRWQRRRLRMRPGLTCLWAVQGRDNLDFETWMRMDMQYIDNWSLGLDARILLMTIPQVLSGKGAS